MQSRAERKRLADRSLILESFAKTESKFAQFNREGVKGRAQRPEKDECETTKNLQLQPVIEMQEEEEEAERQLLRN